MSGSTRRDSAAKVVSENTELTASGAMSQRRARARKGVVVASEETEETERGLMLRIRAELASMPGVLMWRNNVGVDADRGVRYGLGVGSADLVGLLAPAGRMLAFEVKLPRYRGRVRPEQRRWLDVVARHGGVAAVVTSPEEARALVERAVRGLT